MVYILILYNFVASKGSPFISIAAGVKGERYISMSWSKVLSKPFILMQVFFQKRPRNKQVVAV